MVLVMVRMMLVRVLMLMLCKVLLLLLWEMLIFFMLLRVVVRLVMVLCELMKTTAMTGNIFAASKKSYNHKI